MYRNRQLERWKLNLWYDLEHKVKQGSRGRSQTQIHEVLAQDPELILLPDMIPQSEPVSAQCYIH